MPGVPAMGMLDQGVLRPLANPRSFLLGPQAFEVPDPENADDLVARLIGAGLLVADPVVFRVLQGDPPAPACARCSAPFPERHRSHGQAAVADPPCAGGAAAADAWQCAGRRGCRLRLRRPGAPGQFAEADHGQDARRSGAGCGPARAWALRAQRDGPASPESVVFFQDRAHPRWTRWRRRLAPASSTTPRTPMHRDSEIHPFASTFRKPTSTTCANAWRARAGRRNCRAATG